MRDLGTLSGGTTSLGQGINAWGQVTGYGDTADGSMHAFVWKP
jgi:probable HAF family extracellular repeat protein